MLSHLGLMLIPIHSPKDNHVFCNFPWFFQLSAYVDVVHGSTGNSFDLECHMWVTQCCLQTIT